MPGTLFGLKFTPSTDAEKASLTTGAREMILPDGMAAKFQVMTQRKRVV